MRLLLCEGDGLRLLHLYARDEHDRPARSKLHAYSGPHLNRLHDSLAVDVSAVGGVGINEQAETILRAKLCVAARDHGPLRLVKDQMTLRRVAPDLHHHLLKRAFGFLLTITLFNQNDFHMSHPEESGQWLVVGG